MPSDPTVRRIRRGTPGASGGVGGSESQRPAKARKVTANRTADWVVDTFRTRHHPLIGELQRFISLTNEYNNEDRDQVHLHPSEMCKSDWCPRQSFYRMTGVETDGPVDGAWWRLSNIFEEGHFIHDKYQVWLWEMGVLEGMWRCLVCKHRWYGRAPLVCNNKACLSKFIKYAEVPLESEELMLIGHSDGMVVDLDTEKKSLIEIKSIGLRSIEIEVPAFYAKYKAGEEDLMQMWQRIKRPFPVHLRQGQLYCHVLGIDEIIFIYEFKANQDMKAFTVKYQPHLVAPMVTKAQTVVTAVELGRPPRRPEWAEDEKHHVCKDCPFKKTCWKL